MTRSWNWTTGQKWSNSLTFNKFLFTRKRSTSCNPVWWSKNNATNRTTNRSSKSCKTSSPRYKTTSAQLVNFSKRTPNSIKTSSNQALPSKSSSFSWWTWKKTKKKPSTNLDNPKVRDNSRPQNWTRKTHWRENLSIRLRSWCKKLVGSVRRRESRRMKISF